jgi:hypothetical protein
MKDKNGQVPVQYTPPDAGREEKIFDCTDAIVPYSTTPGELVL